MSVEGASRPKFDDQRLQHTIMEFRKVDNSTNLFYLASDYLCLVAVIGGAIWFAA